MNVIKHIKNFIFYISLFMICAVISILRNDADLDLWHRMAVGKIYSQLGSVVSHDIFTYFPSKALWVDHEWLSGVVFYNLTHYFGDYGITAFKIVSLFIVLLLIYKTNQLIFPEQGKHRIVFYIVAILEICTGLISTLRCQAFTYIFFILWLYLLERIRRGENRLIWVFPVTALIWANMHAGFAAGFGLIIFYAAGEFLNKKSYLKYLGILALCIPVTLINPYGLKYWHYLAEALTMARPYITEWEPIKPFESFYSLLGLKLQFLLIVPSIIYAVFTAYKNKNSEKIRLDWVEIIAVVVTLYLSIKHNRHVIFFSIILAVFGFKYYVMFMNFLFADVKKKILSFVPQEKHHLVYFAKYIFTYGLISGFFIMTILSEPIKVKLEKYPPKAVEFIKINKLKGNLLVPFNWGSYALWKLHPQNLISIDGRYEETYTNQAYADSCEITFYGKKWKETFNKYHHDVVLLYKDTAIEKALRKLKDWKVVYEDKEAVVFLPSSFPERKWIQPNQDEDYYIKTKYENNIDFKVKNNE